MASLSEFGAHPAIHLTQASHPSIAQHILHVAPLSCSSAHILSFFTYTLSRIFPKIFAP